jgi:hypothetical protein
MKHLLLVLTLTLARPSYCFNMQWLTNHVKAQSLNVALCTSTAILGYLTYKTKQKNYLLIETNNRLEKSLSIYDYRPAIDSFSYNTKTKILTLGLIDEQGQYVGEKFSLKEGQDQKTSHVFKKSHDQKS